jgi:ABC-type Zn uptake system ZnuABC Zn-binding protein ZnuA
MTTTRSISMKNRTPRTQAVAVAAFTALTLTVLPARAAATTLAVCATIPELGSLARTVGGDHVAVTVFTKPTEDPHFTPARPSFVKAASECDLLLLAGLDLEIGWLPVLLKGSRNGRIQPGQPGYLDASTAIVPMLVPQTTVDRSMGDVHPFGNPHYLADPLNGLAVARLIAATLGAFRPDERPEFEARVDALADRIRTALVGRRLATKYGAEVEKLAQLHVQNALVPYLEAQGERDLLGGWLGALAPAFGTRYVDDHRMWPYFGARFGLVYADSLEPLAGIPPTTRHLQDVIARMRAEGIPLVLAAAYYDPRHAQFVAEATGATVLRMANQAGARPGTDDYVAMIDDNVRQVVTALAARTGPGG